jgi:hypothetical protein
MVEGGWRTAEMLNGGWLMGDDFLKSSSSAIHHPPFSISAVLPFFLSLEG